MVIAEYENLRKAAVQQMGRDVSKIKDEELSRCPENSSIFHFGYYVIMKLIRQNERLNNSYDKNVKELVIPATSMNIEDAKLLINSKVERQRVFDLGKKYAKLFLTYQPSKEQNL